MQITVDLDAPCSPDTLFYWVADLSRYPEWLGIVERAVPEEPKEEPDIRSPGNGEVPAWEVDLSARIGPFSRSKRLRMVRTVFETPLQAVFERQELDRHDHGSWVLRAEVLALDSGAASRLKMDLSYGGRFWGPVLEPILNDEIDRSRTRLLRLVSGE